MVSHLFFYQLVLLALGWLCVMLHWAWPSDTAPVWPTTPEPPPPRRMRKRVPKPFAGLTTKPYCDACVHRTDSRPQPPSAPPPRLVPPRGRRRQVDTSMHFCPNPDCAYRGWVGWGNLRANGHPSGGPWRQLLCVVCRHYFLETLGTLFYGKRASIELMGPEIAPASTSSSSPSSGVNTVAASAVNSSSAASSRFRGSPWRSARRSNQAVACIT